MTTLAHPIKTEAISADNRKLQIVRDVLKTDFDRPMYLDELPASRSWQPSTGAQPITDPGAVAAKGISLDRLRFWALATAAGETCNLRGGFWPVEQHYQNRQGKTTPQELGLSLGQPAFNIALTFSGTVKAGEHPVTREAMTGRWYECSAIALTKVWHADLFKVSADSSQTGQSSIITIGMGGATGGTWAITHRGNTIAAQAYNVATATLDTLLEALSSIGATNIAVTGTAGTSYVLTFSGDLANSEQGITITDNTTGGTGITVTHTQRGFGGSQQLVCDWLGDGYFAVEPDTGSANLSRLVVARRMVM